MMHNLEPKIPPSGALQAPAPGSHTQTEFRLRIPARPHTHPLGYHSPAPNRNLRKEKEHPGCTHLPAPPGLWLKAGVGKEAQRTGLRASTGGLRPYGVAKIRACSQLQPPRPRGSGACCNRKGVGLQRGRCSVGREGSART